MTPSGTVRATRTALVALGVVLLGIGAAALVVGVPLRQWSGILLWFVRAVVLHDAVFAPLVLVGSRMLRRLGRRVPWVQIAVVQVALVVGAALTLVAIPGIRAQSLGARNPTVLPFPYALHLALVWAGLGVVTALTVVAIGLTRRRARRRSA